MWKEISVEQESKVAAPGLTKVREDAGAQEVPNSLHQKGTVVTYK